MWGRGSRDSGFLYAYNTRNSVRLCDMRYNYDNNRPLLDLDVTRLTILHGFLHFFRFCYLPLARKCHTNHRMKVLSTPISKLLWKIRRNPMRGRGELSLGGLFCPFSFPMTNCARTPSLLVCLGAIWFEFWMKAGRVTDGGNLCPLWLVILKLVWHGIGDTLWLRYSWPRAVVSYTFLAVVPWNGLEHSRRKVRLVLFILTEFKI